MNENLKIIAEFVDNASAGLKSAANAVKDFAAGVREGMLAELQATKAHLDAAKAAEDAAKAAAGATAAVEKKTAATSKAKTPVQELEASLKKLALQYLAVTQLIGAFTGSIKEADKLDDLSDKTGISAANLKDLGYAAKIGGSSLEGLLGAFNKLDRAIDKSDEASTNQAKTFKQLGVSTQDASGKMLSSEEIFLKLADTFKGLEDGPEKSAAAFRLFGAEAKNLLPLLNKGSEGINALKKESQDLGGLSAEAFNEYAKASGDLFDGLDKVKLVSDGLFSTMSADLVPTLNVMIQQFVDSAKEGGLLHDIIKGIEATFKNVLVPTIRYTAIIFDAFTTTIKIAGKGIGALVAAVVAVSQGDLKGAGEIFKAYGEDVDKVTQEHVEFADKMALAGHEAVKLADNTEKPKTQLKSLTKQAKEAKSALEEMVKGLRATVGAAGDEFLKQAIEANQKFNADIKKGLNPAREAQLLKEALALIKQAEALKIATKEQEAYDAAKASLADRADEAAVLEYEATLVGQNADARARLVEKFKEEQALRKVVAGLGATDASGIADETRALNERVAAGKAAAADAKVANDIFDNSLGGLQDSFSKRIQIALSLYEQGKITIDDFTRYQTEQYDALLKKTQDTTDKSVIFWQEAAKGIQDALQTFFFDFMQGKMSNLGNSFKALIDKMVANALAANLGEALFGANFEKGGKLGGYAGAALSSIGSFFGGARALGGPVQAGKAYLVNENTANSEIFVPSTSGTIIPHGEAAQANGGVTVHMAINATDPQSFLAQMANVKRDVAQMMMETTRNYNLGR